MEIYIFRKMKSVLEVKLSLIRVHFIIWVHKYKKLNSFYRFIFRFIYKKNKNSHVALKNVHFSDLNALQLCQNYYPSEYYRDNLYYGISSVLKNYSGYDGAINAYIEHGVFFGSFLGPDERHIFSKKILCMGNRRERQLKNLVGKEPIAIGPYIHYADYFSSKAETLSHKQKLGRTLLLFPSHSTKEILVDYNVDIFLEKCASKFSEYDSIMVCLYWSDLKRFSHLYEKKGLKVVSAGNLNDPNFLPRLKTIIGISDYVVTDTVGTHVGYCFHLNKEVWILPGEIILRELREPYKSFQAIDYHEKVLAELSEIKSVFETPQAHFSKDQKSLVEEFWGIDKIKNPKELKRILGH